MSSYKLSRKNAQGKWWTFGRFAMNKFNNYSASFKVSALEELVALAKAENQEWVNLSAFEDTEEKAAPKVAPAPVYDDLDDSEAPF